MATLEERLASLEHEQAELKQKNADLKEKIDLLTVSVGALVNKATLEQLKEQNEKIFEALQGHDTLTNLQLSEIRETTTELDGKIVGLQTEMRQGFASVNARFDTMATKDDLNTVNARFDAVDARFDHIDARFNQIMIALAALKPKPDQEA